MQQGWVGITNGKLLALAAAEFDVFVTVDRNLPFQQHLPKFDIAIVSLMAKSNRLADLQALIPNVLTTIPLAVKSQVTRVSA